MGARIVARNQTGHLVEAGNGTHSVVLDLAKEYGGPGNGLGPHETLLAALGGCTAMTLKVYASRKGWPLEGSEITLTHEPVAPGAGPDAKETLGVELKLFGPLDAAQRTKLLEIAQKCPVYRTLTSDLDVKERLVG